MNDLTIQDLEHSLKKNTKYYTKYLDKFNNQGFFASFNFASFFFAIPFSMYRKRWISLGFYVFALIMAAYLYFEIIENDIEPIILILYFTITILIMLGSSITTNYFILKDIKINKKSYYLKPKVVLLLTLIASSPLYITGYDLYKKWQAELDYRSAKRLNTTKDINAMKNIIATIDDKHIHALFYREFKKAQHNIICNKDLSILQQIKDKGYIFRERYTNQSLPTSLFKPVIEVECYDESVLQFLVDNTKLTDNEYIELIAKTIERVNFEAFAFLTKYRTLTPKAQILFATILAYEYKLNDPTQKNMIQIINLKTPRNYTKDTTSKYLKHLLKHTPVDTKISHQKMDISALSIAIDYGDIRLARAIIKKGVNINWQYTNIYNQNDKTHLSMALDTGNIEMIHLILNSGFDVNASHVNKYRGTYGK